MSPSEGQDTVDCGQEYLPLLFGIYRIPFEIDPYAEVGEQPRRVLVKMQKRFRFSVENTKLLLPDMFLRSDLLEKIRQALQRGAGRMLHGKSLLPEHIVGDRDQSSMGATPAPLGKDRKGSIPDVAHGY